MTLRDRELVDLRELEDLRDHEDLRELMDLRELDDLRELHDLRELMWDDRRELVDRRDLELHDRLEPESLSSNLGVPWCPELWVKGAGGSVGPRTAEIGQWPSLQLRGALFQLWVYI